MVFIQDNGREEELSEFEPEQQVQLYLDRYLSFFDEFQGMDCRKVDQALWQAGKFLKDGGLPPIRKPVKH